MNRKTLKKAFLMIAVILISIVIGNYVNGKMIEKERIVVDGVTLAKVCIDGKLFILVKSSTGNDSDLEQVFINHKIPVSCLSD